MAMTLEEKLKRFADHLDKTAVWNHNFTEAIPLSITTKDARTGLAYAQEEYADQLRKLAALTDAEIEEKYPIYTEVQ